jgi:hypothetical protein
VHDDLVRIPCAVHIPPSVPSDVRARLEQAASTSVGVVDLLPTLLDIAGGCVPDGLSGRSLVAPAATEPDRRVVRIEDRRYLYLGSRLRLNTNAQGKNMSRVAKARNRVWRATLIRSHVLQGFVDGPRKLIVTELIAPSSFAARAGSSYLARRHNGDPLVVVRGNSWFGLELFDVDADAGERNNLLRDRRDLADPAMAAVDAYRAGDFTPDLAALQ